jgi:DNA-binding IclR family transcriptional regulator
VSSSLTCSVTPTREPTHGKAVCSTKLCAACFLTVDCWGADRAAPPHAVHAQTITSKTALRAELERIVAEDGVAIEDGELSAGGSAIAAVVVDAEGQPVAAVELEAPAEAYTRKELVGLGAKMTATAGRIASALD